MSELKNRYVVLERLKAIPVSEIGKLKPRAIFCNQAADIFFELDEAVDAFENRIRTRTEESEILLIRVPAKAGLLYLTYPILSRDIIIRFLSSDKTLTIFEKSPINIQILKDVQQRLQEED